MNRRTRSFAIAFLLLVSGSMNSLAATNPDSALIVKEEWNAAKTSTLKGRYDLALEHISIARTLASVGHVPLPDGLNELHGICVRLQLSKLTQQINHEYHRAEINVAKELISMAETLARENGAVVPERVLVVKRKIESGRLELFDTEDAKFEQRDKTT